MDNQPHVITKKGWKEIVSLPPVRGLWGLADAADPLEFASTVYGARFDFVSGGPGYVGDAYVIHGNALTEVSLIVLRRDKQGKLNYFAGIQERKGSYCWS